MVRTRLNIGCRYSTPVRERPLHPTRGHFTPEPSQTQAPVTPATEPERRAGGSLTTAHLPDFIEFAQFYVVSDTVHRSRRSSSIFAVIDSRCRLRGLPAESNLRPSMEKSRPIRFIRGCVSSLSLS